MCVASSRVVCCEDGALDPFPTLLTTAQDRQGFGVAVFSLALEEALPCRDRIVVAHGLAFLSLNHAAGVMILPLGGSEMLEGILAIGFAELCRARGLISLAVPVGEGLPIDAVPGPQSIHRLLAVLFGSSTLALIDQPQRLRTPVMLDRFRGVDHCLRRALAILHWRFATDLTFIII